MTELKTRRVVVDPVTRIEGHLRVQAEINDDNVIVDSQSTGTMWRGLEVILKGRDPRDAWASSNASAASAPGFTHLRPYAPSRTLWRSTFPKTPISSAT